MDPTGGGSSLVALAPLLEAGNIEFAAIGLTDMLNSNGAVLDTRLHAAASGKSNSNGSSGYQNGSRNGSPSVTGWLN